MPLYEEQKKQLAKSAKASKPSKRKARKASQPKLKRRNQEDKLMFNTRRGVEQVKAKAPISKVKELAAEHGTSGNSQGGEPVLNSKRPMRQLKKERLKELFLEALTKSFSVAGAARRIETARSVVYRWRDEDANFASAWDDCIEAHVDDVEAAIQEAALNLNQPHKVTAAAIFLNANRSDKYTPRHRHEHSGLASGPILLAVAAKIQKMDTEELRVELGKLLGSALVEIKGKE